MSLSEIVSGFSNLPIGNFYEQKVRVLFGFHFPAFSGIASHERSELPKKSGLVCLCLL
jgi:hypothetical protein